MSRLVRLLSASHHTALHAFGRLRDTRKRRSCREKIAHTPVPFGVNDGAREGTRFCTPGSLPVKRTAAVRPVQGVSAAPAVHARNAVRVYRGASGTTMVGRIDAICKMIDRCIADERDAQLSSAREAAGSV